MKEGRVTPPNHFGCSQFSSHATLCFVISNQKKLKFHHRCFHRARGPLTFLGQARAAEGGKRGSGRPGTQCGFTPCPQPFHLPPLSLPVTLSGLHGRSARPPSPSSSAARLRARGPLHATGSRESAPAPDAVTHYHHSLLPHPSVFPFSHNSIYNLLHLTGFVSSHPTGRQATSLGPQSP